MSERTKPTCPSFETLSAAFSARAPGPLADHLTGCAACARAWRDLEALRAAGQHLPVYVPDAARAHVLEAELLARVRSSGSDAERRLKRWRRAAVALAAALLLAIGGAVVSESFEHERSSPPREVDAPLAAWPAAPVAPAVPAAPVAPAAPVPAVHRGTIRAASGARFEHSTRHAPAAGIETDEVVRVADGTVQVDVAPLAAGERFRVLTLDAEVEVRGTSFEVEVRDDRLIAVVVRSGLVEVRPKSGAPRLLSMGQRWDAAVIAEPPVRNAPATAAPRTRAPERVRAPEPEPEPAPPVAAPAPSIPDATPSIPDPAETELERTFAEAFDLLKSGDASAAADRFADLDASSHALDEDVLYWRAVALGRAARETEAEQVLRRFLDRHPRSVRAGEVSVMLGWRLLERGALEAAAERFEAAARDPSARVRGAARSGLEAVRERSRR